MVQTGRQAGSLGRSTLSGSRSFLRGCSFLETHVGAKTGVSLNSPAETWSVGPRDPVPQMGPGKIRSATSRRVVGKEPEERAASPAWTGGRGREACQETHLVS